jgi:hypothetical protein
MVVQDPSLAARNRAFERALRATVLKPVADPTIEEAEDTKTNCTQAPGPVDEPNEGAERQGTEPVESARTNADAAITEPTEDHVTEPVAEAAGQMAPRRRPQRDPAAEFLLNLMREGRIREDMKPGERFRIFKRYWPRKKPRPERDSVRRAWNELLESGRVAARRESPFPLPKK